MKTAEDWQKRYWQLREGKRDIPKVEGLNQWDILVKEIQLDAWKQGMTDAKDKVIFSGGVKDSCCNNTLHEACKDIEFARDSKTLDKL